MKQLLPFIRYLHRLLGFTPPRFMHIPLLCAPDGRRLSKRDGDLDMGALRAGGVRAQAIIGFLLFRAGILKKWEPISAKEAITVYALEKMTREDIAVTPQDVRRLYGGAV